jgi:hypothetical protein
MAAAIKIAAPAILTLRLLEAREAQEPKPAVWMLIYRLGSSMKVITTLVAFSSVRIDRSVSRRFLARGNAACRRAGQGGVTLLHCAFWALMVAASALSDRSK